LPVPSPGTAATIYRRQFLMLKSVGKQRFLRAPEGGPHRGTMTRWVPFRGCRAAIKAVAVIALVKSGRRSNSAIVKILLCLRVLPVLPFEIWLSPPRLADQTCSSTIDRFSGKQWCSALMPRLNIYRTRKNAIEKTHDLMPSAQGIVIVGCAARARLILQPERSIRR
jgi:hypothetical protein